MVYLVIKLLIYYFMSLPTTTKGYEALEQSIQRQKKRDKAIEILEYIAILCIVIISVIKL